MTIVTLFASAVVSAASLTQAVSGGRPHVAILAEVGEIDMGDPLLVRIKTSAFREPITTSQPISTSSGMVTIEVLRPLTKEFVPTRAIGQGLESEWTNGKKIVLQPYSSTICDAWLLRHGGHNLFDRPGTWQLRAKVNTDAGVIVSVPVLVRVHPLTIANRRTSDANSHLTNALYSYSATSAKFIKTTKRLINDSSGRNVTVHLSYIDTLHQIRDTDSGDHVLMKSLLRLFDEMTRDVSNTTRTHATMELIKVLADKKMTSEARNRLSSVSTEHENMKYLLLICNR